MPRRALYRIAGGADIEMAPARGGVLVGSNEIKSTRCRIVALGEQSLHVVERGEPRRPPSGGVSRGTNDQRLDLLRQIRERHDAGAQARFSRLRTREVHAREAAAEGFQEPGAATAPSARP